MMALRRAVQLCNGVEMDQLGDPIDVVTLLPQIVPLVRTDDDGTVHAEVLWVDAFGNAQLNVGPEDIDAFGERLVLRWGLMPIVTRAAAALLPSTRSRWRPRRS